MIAFYSNHSSFEDYISPILEKIKKQNSLFCSKKNLWGKIFLLLWLRFQKREREILFTDEQEKLWLSPLAKNFGMKVYWILWKENSYRGRKKKHYSRASRGVTLIATSQSLLEKEKTDFLLAPEKEYILRPYFSPLPLHQENFFEEMAYKKYAVPYRKNFILGAIAPLTKESGIEYTFQVIQLLKEQLPNIQLIIVGHGPEKNNLLWLARNIHIAENIRIIGTEENAALWMDGFTIFLAPRQHGLWHTPEISLAMRCGKPIVAQKSPYTEELLTNTKEAILLDMGNTEMVTQAIVNMANKPEWIHELGANAKKRAEELFSDEKWNQQFNQIFK